MKRLDIMLPVYYKNLPEIEPSIKKLLSFFPKALKNYDWNIVLAINGKTPEKVITLAKKLHKKNQRVTYDYTEQPGKGSGIIHSWSRSKADILSYMDIDLSADLRGFPNLISQIEKGYDISIGSRYHPQSDVKRSFKRTFISIGYNRVFMRLVLGAKDYTDAQCGFKAITREAAKRLLPLIKNRNWFFESELLYIAQRKGFKIKEVPVNWTESQFSGIKLYKAIIEFLVSSLKLRLRKI
jgi:glycosyltransferase involved in cell wall biosynthesis